MLESEMSMLLNEYDVSALLPPLMGLYRPVRMRNKKLEKMSKFSKVATLLDFIY